MGLKYEPQDSFETKQEISNKLLTYRSVQDADFVWIKAKIKETLVHCPQLLYALHNTELEPELFDSDGNLLDDGEWDAYLKKNIRGYMFYPETQTHVMNYVSFKVDFDEYPSVNGAVKYCDITFVVMAAVEDIEQANGILRHDELAAILVDRFSGSNIFGTRASLISSKEGYTDSAFLTRTLVFRITNLNGKIKSQSGKSRLVGQDEVYN